MYCRDPSLRTLRQSSPCGAAPQTSSARSGEAMGPTTVRDDTCGRGAAPQMSASGLVEPWVLGTSPRLSGSTHLRRRRFPSPSWGGVRGGGNPGLDCLGSGRICCIHPLQSPPPCPSPTRGEGTMELMLSVPISAPCPETTVSLRCATDSMSCCRHFKLNRTAVRQAQG